MGVLLNLSSSLVVVIISLFTVCKIYVMVLKTTQRIQICFGVIHTVHFYSIIICVVILLFGTLTH